jgi:hypothetical protein
MARNRDGKRPRRPNPKGRTEKAGRFVMLSHALLKSAAYASLDLVARGLLQELVMIYNGDNNGSIYLSATDATARLGLSDRRPAMRAFDELCERGFIAMAKEAHFAIKASDKSRARCWRLTWHAWPECPVRSKRAPTCDWEDWSPVSGTPDSKRADKRLRALDRYRKAVVSGYFAGVKSSPMEPNMPDIAAKAGAKSSPDVPEIDANQPSVIGVKSSPYIYPTMGSADVGWFAAQAEVDLAARHAFFVWIAGLNGYVALAA